MRNARGSNTDRPWGLVLGELGLGGCCAELVLRDKQREFRVTFHRGVLVHAASPLAVDAVVRVALTNHVISSPQANECKRRIAAAPSLDELDIVAAVVNLPPDQVRTLRNRVIVQRAARTFAVEDGEFQIEELPRSAAPPSGGVDVRTVVLTGARMNLAEDRLMQDLRRFGAAYKLRPQVVDDLAKYGFSDEERPALEALRNGTSLPDLEALHRELDPRALQAMIYALGSCDALVETDGVRRRSQSMPVVSASQTMQAVSVSQTMRAVSGSQVIPAVSPPLDLDDLAEGTPSGVPLEFMDVHQAQTRAVPYPLAADPHAHETRRVSVPPELLRGVLNAGNAAPRELMDTFKTGASTTVRPNALTRRETEVLIRERATLLDAGADHFTLLGLPVGAAIEDVHAAYVEISRNLKPARLIELGIIDDTYKAHVVLAQIGIAFTVLTDRERRPVYIASLQSKLVPRTASRR